MTSLVLFDSDRSNQEIREGTDWGTGKTRSRLNVEPSHSHESGTFLYKGEPIQQNYRNTDITLSNVRINDELIPAPFHSIDLTHEQIPLKFPSNHPFASHICEKSIFPTSTTEHEDRPSTDADPYVVTHKIRGNPYRREVHFVGPLQRENRQDRWPDQQFMHLSRSVSDLSPKSIYPWPRQIFSPNHEETKIHSGTNVVENKDRALKQTVYQADYSTTDGLGSHVVFDTTVRLGVNDSLKPHFRKTLDPARPIDGVQADQIHGNHRQGEIPTDQHKSPFRVMSLDEKLDDQLRNGTNYVNLPEKDFSNNLSARWNESNMRKREEPVAKEIRYLKPEKKVNQLERDHQRTNQQIEAENRLKELELIRPSDNLQLLNVKQRNLQNPRHSRPILPQYHDDFVGTFYDQIGNFVQERSGLYQTQSYKPKFLSQSMLELSHDDDPEENRPALKTEENLNHLLDKGEKTGNRSKEKLFQYKTLGNFESMRNDLVKKFRVPFDSSTVDPRIQEGRKATIQRETIYGSSFNTRKFLEENVLSSEAQLDPTSLMSTESNVNLERVRMLNSFPRVPKQIEEKIERENPIDVAIGPLIPPSPFDEFYCNDRINEQTDGFYRRNNARVYDSPFKTEHENPVYRIYKKEQRIVDGYPKKSDPLPQPAKLEIRLPNSQIISRQKQPVQRPNSTYQHDFQDVSFYEMITPLDNFQPTINDPQRLAMKDNDPRFGRLNDGRVKQWKLIDLQDRWTKTNAQRQYHQQHPESVPYVGEATVRTNKEILIVDTIKKQRMMPVR